MKRTILAVCALSAMALFSCNQAPKEPTAEEVEAKVQNLYGAALETQKQLRAAECDASVDATVAQRLKDAAAAATPAK